MVTTVLIAGIIASLFVGFNIGGSSTGIAWGPPVGAGVIRKVTAAGLMVVFVFLGGWTVGRNVIETLSGDIITIAISLEAGVAVLFFIGLGILIANIFGVPVPTSMTTVSAIAGLGLATNTLNYATMGEIVSWWFVTPVIGFWIGAIIGRYLYPTLSDRIDVSSTEGPLVSVGRRGLVPTVSLGPNTTSRELVSTFAVLTIGCYMSFSAGASNVPNAVAPLVSSGALDPNLAIVLATAAIGFGGFTIARRTMQSVGTELSDIPLLAALIVMLVSATITTFLSSIGIPISLVMGMVMTIVGLGWGRATRPITARDAFSGEVDSEIATGALTAAPEAPMRKIGQRESQAGLDAGELFNPRAIAKYISMWIIGPTVALGLSYGFFVLFPVAV
jgi:PiT family inorganic phosphate transporter